MSARAYMSRATQSQAFASQGEINYAQADVACLHVIAQRDVHAGQKLRCTALQNMIHLVNAKVVPSRSGLCTGEQRRATYAPAVLEVCTAENIEEVQNSRANWGMCDPWSLDGRFLVIQRPEAYTLVNLINNRETGDAIPSRAAWACLLLGSRPAAVAVMHKVQRGDKAVHPVHTSSTTGRQEMPSSSSSPRAVVRCVPIWTVRNSCTFRRSRLSSPCASHMMLVINLILLTDTVGHGLKGLDIALQMEDGDGCAPTWNAR